MNQICKIALGKPLTVPFRALRVSPAVTMVDGLPRVPSTGSGHELDLARGSVTCLGYFDLKMYIMEKLFDIIRGRKTIF